MKTRILTLFLSLRTNYWFLPSIMIFGAFWLAILMLRLDAAFSGTFPEKISWIMGMGPEGVRQVLALIATSMITVAGVAFSITVVALALASQQFGPRLLQNFMRDLGNQLVLGTFTATFLYCVLILPGVLGAENHQFIPYYSASVGIFLAIGSLIVLVYFIHHIPASIQANHVIGLVQKELLANVRKFIPERNSREIGYRKIIPAPFHPEAHFFSKGLAVKAESSGYIQAFDIEGLVACAKRNNIFIRLRKKVGDFVIREESVAWVHGPELSAEMTEEVAGKVLTGDSPTPAQDLEFSLNELVEVALRALSPGINDPKTALQCIDCLTESLAEIVKRGQWKFLHQDSEGKFRLFAKPLLFEDFIETAFNEIRQASVRSVAVMIHLLESFEKIGGFAWREENLRGLQKHGEMVQRLAQRTLQEKHDLEEVEDRYWRLLQVLYPSRENGGFKE